MSSLRLLDGVALDRELYGLRQRLGGVITFPGFARFGKQELNRHRKFGLLFHLDAGTLPQ